MLAELAFWNSDSVQLGWSCVKAIMYSLITMKLLVVFKKKLQNVSNSGDIILSQIYFALFSSNEIL